MPFPNRSWVRAGRISAHGHVCEAQGLPFFAFALARTRWVPMYSGRPRQKFRSTSCDVFRLTRMRLRGVVSATWPVQRPTSAACGAVDLAKQASGRG